MWKWILKIWMNDEEVVEIVMEHETRSKDVISLRNVITQMSVALQFRNINEKSISRESAKILKSFLAWIQNNNRNVLILALKFWLKIQYFFSVFLNSIFWQRQIFSCPTFSLTSNKSRDRKRKWGWKKCQSALHDIHSIGYK